MSCSYGLLFEPCNRVVVLVSRFVVCTISMRDTPCALTLVARAINTEYGIGTPILGCHFRHPFLYVLWDVSSDTGLGCLVLTP